MADVKEHLDRLHEQADLLRIIVKLMQSADKGQMFELGKHGTILMTTFASMMHSMATRIEDNVKDLDLAISMQGHKGK